MSTLVEKMGCYPTSKSKSTLCNNLSVQMRWLHNTIVQMGKTRIGQMTPMQTALSQILDQVDQLNA